MTPLYFRSAKGRLTINCDSQVAQRTLSGTPMGQQGGISKTPGGTEHLTSLTIQLGKNPRIRSEYATLTAKPTEEREAWLAMLLVNAYYAGYARSLNQEVQKKAPQ
jgi:hypothetical protein